MQNVLGEMRRNAKTGYRYWRVGPLHVPGHELTWEETADWGLKKANCTAVCTVCEVKGKDENKEVHAMVHSLYNVLRFQRKKEGKAKGKKKKSYYQEESQETTQKQGLLQSR